MCAPVIWAYDLLVCVRNDESMCMCAKSELRERWSKNTLRKSKQLQIEECKWLIVEFSFCAVCGGACFRFRPSKNVWKNILNYLLWAKRLNGAMHKLDSSHLVYYYSFQRRSVRWPSAHFPCLVSQLHRPSCTVLGHRDACDNQFKCNSNKFCCTNGKVHAAMMWRCVKYAEKFKCGNCVRRNRMEFVGKYVECLVLSASRFDLRWNECA